MMNTCITAVTVANPVAKRMTPFQVDKSWVHCKNLRLLSRMTSYMTKTEPPDPTPQTKVSCKNKLFVDGNMTSFFEKKTENYISQVQIIA